MEIFKKIPGYKDYQASTLGKIKSNKNKKERIMKTFIYPDGYEGVQLFNEGKRKTIKIHRLIMLAFKGKSELDVNHKNGIKHDNRLENLEYCTQSENTIHSYKMGLQVVAKGEKNKTSKKINQYTLRGEFVKTWGCMSDIGRKMGVSIGNISSCCNGDRNYAYNFIWKFN